jgi:endoglucanase
VGVTFSVSRWIAPVLAVATVVGLGTVGPAGPSPAIRLVSDNNPLAGRPFYVNPTSAAMRASQKVDPPSPQLNYVANTPQAYWLVPGSSASTVAKYAGDAAAAGATPVFAIYGIPHRDCGSYAAGGFGSGDEYRGWIDGIANDIGPVPSAVILEPDALAMADCLSDSQRQERYDLISYAIGSLTRNPATAVYVDAGQLKWHSPEDMAGRLNQVGVNRARGFSLNVANFFTTEDESGYGEAISGLTNGAHYVIDTSRNGNGPAPAAPLDWCNPGGRALGVAPTTATAAPHADAYLWVKRPGESDGGCDKGDPPAGTFVNQYAIDLATASGH